MNKNKILFSPLKNSFPFNTATDGGGSKQYHVLLSAKHDIKSVQGRTDLIWLPTYGRNSFCEEERINSYNKLFIIS